jgi:hypothetical protein
VITDSQNKEIMNPDQIQEAADAFKAAAIAKADEIRCSARYGAIRSLKGVRGPLNAILNKTFVRHLEAVRAENQKDMTLLEGKIIGLELALQLVQIALEREGESHE